VSVKGHVVDSRKFVSTTPVALIAAAHPGITTAFAHLRDVLGDERYESLARNGEMMIFGATTYESLAHAR
jgi:hypothetical protein